VLILKITLSSSEVHRKYEFPHFLFEVGQEVIPKTIKEAEVVQNLYFAATTLLPSASPAGSVEGSEVAQNLYFAVTTLLPSASPAGSVER
jgi:hypothetical protein